MSPDRPLSTLSSLIHDLDTERRARLKRNRMFATGLLGAMGAVYAGTHAVSEPGFATLLVRSAAEAGVVGGLADWFAVSALFRHPLGLPIPHTAIIPRSKERIARTLSRFVEQNFLTEEVLIKKLNDAQAGRAFAAWLASAETASTISNWMVGTLPQLIRALENREFHSFVNRALGEQLREADVAPIMGRLLQIFTESGEADALFDRILDEALIWIEGNEKRIYRIVKERSRWWIPPTIDRRIAGAIISGAAQVLSQLREPQSEARAAFRRDLSRLIWELMTSQRQRDEINAIKDRLLRHPEVQAWLASVWKELSRMTLVDLEQPHSKLRSALEKAISSLGEALASDEAMLKRIDATAERLAMALVLRRGAISGLVAEVVNSWDARTLTDRLELIFGSDLQYIRMNGTVVGAAVGCLIFTVTRLLALGG